MSISSCKKFLCANTYVTVKRLKNAVEIDYEAAPVWENTTGSISSNSVTINNTDHFVPGQQVVIQDGNGYVPNRVGYVHNIASSTYNQSTHFHCVGYRLFMLDGLLKCVKKEVAAMSYATIVSSGSTALNVLAPQVKPRESFYHPSTAMDHFYTEECRGFIQECIDSLAKDRGVVVPEKFKIHGEHHNGLSRISYMAILDWLAYPIIREIDSPAVCKNLLALDRNLIAPKFSGMNFRKLIEHYYGTVTSKMLEEIWKVAVVGNDFKKTVFQEEIAKQVMQFAMQGAEVLQCSESYVVQTGDRHIQTSVFVIGPAIFKTMGFDYFYQALPSFSQSFGRRFDPDDGSAKKIEFDLVTLLKHISPKKMISVLFENGKKPDLHSLYDTARMLREYDSFEKIPRQIRMQYPTGLVVDFKFKTLKELHDKISTQYTIIKTESTRKEILVSDLYGLLDGRERDGCTLVVPTNTSTLAVWGKLLSICVASYGDRAARGDCLILGVEKEGQIKYCIEFHSLVVPKLPNEPLVGIVDPSKLSVPAIEPEYLRVPYPKLVEKHVGVTPTDTPPEDEIYHIPSIVQFRGMRNCDPDKQDEIIVHNMLIEWTRENFEYLSSLKGIFDIGFSGFNMEAFNQHIQQNVGQPDRLLLNPQAYADLQRALAVPNQAVNMDNDGHIPLAFGNGINVIVDHNIPNDELWAVNANANPQLMIENIGVDVI